MWQPVGVIVASGIAYGTAAKWRCDPKLDSCAITGPGEACCTVSSNMGWRYNVIVLGLMTLAIFFLRFFVFKFHESPKFLLARGREAEAIDVLHKIAKFNRAPAPTLTLEMFRQIEALDPEFAENSSALPAYTSRAEKNKAVFKNAGKELKRLKGIFTNKLTCFIFILLAIAYMGDYWSFNLAGAFLPIILLRNNVDEGRGSVQDTYQQYIIIYTPGIIGAVLALASVQMPLIGRKWSLVFSAICQGLAMAMYTQVKNTAGYVGLNALEYIMQTVSSLLSKITNNCQLTLRTVLQRRALRFCARAIRHGLSRQCQWYAVVSGSYCWYCGTVCWCSASCRPELRHLVAWCRWYLAFGARHGLPACGDEEQADVLSEELECVL